MAACSAFGCTNRPSKCMPHISFHKFPLDEPRRTKWILAVRRQNWMPSKYSRLCSIHFTDDMIDRSMKNKLLKPNAVPSVFPAFAADYQKDLMVCSCCAVGCTNRFIKGSGISFHVFPIDETRRTLWTLALKRKNWQPTTHSLVCGQHFQTGKPSRDENHPDYVPNIFSFSKEKVRSAEQYENRQKLSNPIALANESDKVIKENVEVTSSLQIQDIVSGFDDLEKHGLKIAVPSQNLSASLKSINGAQNKKRCKESEKLKCSNKRKNLETETQNCTPDECVNELVDYEMSNIVFSVAEINKDPDNITSDIPQPIITNCISSDNIDTETTANISCYRSSEMCTKQPTVQEKNVSDPTEEIDIFSEDITIFDYSAFDSSSHDSDVTLRKKLRTMVAVNKMLQAKVKLYHNKYKMCKKEVKILKGVIEDLKLINSVTADS